MGYKAWEILELTPLQKAALITSWLKRLEKPSEERPLSDLLGILPKA